jgi:mono/diheme cytochrome c family protein
MGICPLSSVLHPLSWKEAPMARSGMILTLFATLSLFLLTSTIGGNQATAAPSEAKAKQPGFELPHKPKSTLTASEQRGRDLYEYYCAICHGKTGEGDGFNSFQLSVPPAKHADAALMSTLSDADIREVIKGGGPALGRSPLMPPWGRVLTDRDVADLVVFIRTLSKK